MDTPFKQILHTNTVPSDVECERIRKLLVGPRKEVVEIRHEIDRIQALLQELAVKRDHLNDFIEAHEALISPARRLPEDVVAEIFTASLPSDKNAIMSGEESPLLLCHVSRPWRNLALATPRLWASLHIVASDSISKLHETNEAASIWLSRSGVLPLSISLVCTPASTVQTDFSILLETLVQYSSRWHRIRIKLQSHRSFKPFAVLSPSHVPILEFINIDGFERAHDGHDIDWSAVSFLGTTSLRSVTLQHIGSFLPFPLPHNRLRYLSLGSSHSAVARTWLTAEEGLDILRWCPNLEACTLPFWRAPQNESLTLPACRMEHLRQLSVFESFPNTSTGFFRKLELPTLRALEYDTYGAGDSEFLPFTSLLTSVHHIQYLGLRIEHEPMPCEVIIAGLRLMPALRELAISFDWSIDSKFWTSITPTSQNLDNVLCPDLEVVKFSQFQATSDNELLEFIQARTGARFPHIASLSQAKVHFIRPRQIDILPALRQAVDDGLDFSLRYEHKPPTIRYSPSQENHAHTRGEVLSDHWDESWEYA